MLSNLLKKECRCCGRVHGARQWRLLPYVGIQHFGEEQLELRNCVCGSTLAIAALPSNTVTKGASHVAAR